MCLYANEKLENKNEFVDKEDCILGFFEHLHLWGCRLKNGCVNSCCFSQLLRSLG